MIVVYPLARQTDYTELRYSIRSVEKYSIGETQVIIVGDDIPEWLVNVTWIKLKDIEGRKQLNIKSKIIAAIEHAKEPVFMMNDDHYLLDYTNLSKFPYYYEGVLKGKGESGARMLNDELLKMGKGNKNFDIHYPIRYNPDFIEIFKLFTADCVIKSAYCNYLGIEGEHQRECKVLKAAPRQEVDLFIKDLPSFSTGSLSLKSCLPLLKELFHVKSKYEL